jgi:hypothetical protein
MSDEYKENVKYETFTHFWNDNFGADYGYDEEHKRPLEPYYSIAEYSWEMGENHGYYLGKDYGNINKGE